ncbi:MAG TPA: thiamine pyrophosphate-dependent enzyme, partial [Polyangiaceae bacterium]|nr:thiamine pyrophosphate-dependent enzyme [Polyangiaceae bacterium]
AIKAVAYGLHGVRVDGADVLAVLSVVREARERAVDGRGATLVEAVVPGVDRVDPLVRMRRHLEARSLWDEGREGRLKADAAADVDRALAEAAAAAKPEPGTLFDDVYAHPPWHLQEQRRAR